MSDIKPLDFGAAMAQRGNAAQDTATNDSLVVVRSFTPDGIVQVEGLLRKMRMNKQFYGEEVAELIEDPQYSSPIDPKLEIDKDKKFATKRDLCEYLSSVFSDSFLADHRKETGLWTWLAFAYFTMFLKKANEFKVATNPRWIFDFENYRLAVRHYVAGPLYLWLDFRNADNTIRDMLFSESPAAFGGFIDAIAYRMEATRIPAVMQVAAWLYYDGNDPKKLKKSAANQHRPGAIRELLRVVSQFAQTRDFYGIGDANELWRILPSQFNTFKGESTH